MTFDKVCGAIMLAVLSMAFAAAGIALIQADVWWFSPLGFPCVMWSCEAGLAFWKRVWP